MYCMDQDREELEDDLYKEDEADSDGSEATSELEFRLYSQLHYSSNAGEMEELVDRGEEVEGQDSQQLEVTEKPADVDGEQEHPGESRPPSPNVNKLQQHLKKNSKREKRKQKKEKSNPQGQRSTSSFLEEVIVIDSSPSVISISEGNSASDDDDEEEGVCALKGQSMQRLQTSTPAQQGTQKRKRSLNVPVTVDSSSSDSDSEKSESKSESDSSELSESSESSEWSNSSGSEGLENWMILGHGNQDGDLSISLNLEGVPQDSADVEEDSSWLITDRDKEAQIYNKDKGARAGVQRLSNRYYTTMNVHCRNCNKMGHLSKNCPEPKKLPPCFLCGTQGHLASQCPNRYCNNCGMPGHLYESCSEKAYWHKICHRCNMKGHFFDACPEIWRQYHITTMTSRPVEPLKEDHGRTPAYCYNCSRKGHFGHACTRQRMFNGTYPTNPFINHYDTLNEIHRRQHRMKMKVKELKENGLFPGGSQTPLTPGPPKKKQKFNHQKNNHPKNNHQSKHTPNRIPKSHKPSGSHIFFNDNHDFRAPRSKPNKRNKSQQQVSTGNVKPWKPKRPVPISKDPPPKLILDEAGDFPRGGGEGESIVVKRNRKQRRKMKQAESKKEKEKGRRRGRAEKTAAKRAEQMYPTDENLFIIKQRKRSR